MNYPSGCIVAKANLVDCIEINDAARVMLNKKNSLVYSNVIRNTDWKGYGFKLENVSKVKEIKINGKLSLWDYDGEFTYE